VTSRRPAFSLVEVLVATAVLVAVLVPLFYMFTQSVRQTSLSLDELEATNLAEEIADQVQAVPVVAGFARMPSYPAGNDPPLYVKWRDVKASGLAFPAAAPGLSIRLDTERYTRTGVPYPQEEAQAADAVYQRLWLSPAADRYARRLRVHRVLERAGALEENPGMVQVDVVVEWRDQFASGPRPARQVTMRAIVSNPLDGIGGF
jgi:hypothetical protein